MNNTLTTRKELLGFVDETLAKVGVQDVINAFLNSEQAKEMITEKYDAIMKRLNDMHEKAPEERKEKSKEALKSIVSKEEFFTQIANGLKTSLITTILEWNVQETDENFEESVEAVKKAFEEISDEAISILNDYVCIEEHKMFRQYTTESYIGYLPADMPEEVADFLMQFMEDMGAIHIPLEVLFTTNNDECES